MRAYRTGDSRHPDAGVNPYADLLAQGPPSTRPKNDGAAPGGTPADAASGGAPVDGAGPGGAAAGRAPADGAGPDGATVDGTPGRASAGAGVDAAVATAQRGSGAPHGVTVTVVRPGGLSPRRPQPRPVPRAALAPARGRTPGRRRNFRPFYKLAAWLVLGLGIGGAFLVGVAVDRLGAWDHEVRVQEETELSFPPVQERWIWLPEERMGDIVCTATDGTGADLPMRPALGYDHDDFASAFRFPTGDGDVTLRCDGAPSPATAGWAPSGIETVRVAEPVDRGADLPFLQATLVLTMGGPALGVLVLIGTLLTQVVTAVRDAVGRRQR